MTEPTISVTENFSDNSIVYRLKVPGFWLVTTTYPRLRLSWWLLRMLWQERPK